MLGYNCKLLQCFGRRLGILRRSKARVTIPTDEMGITTRVNADGMERRVSGVDGFDFKVVERSYDVWFVEVAV